MLGPYIAKKNGIIAYEGNKVFPKVKNILQENYSSSVISNRVSDMANNELWTHIARMNNQLFLSAVEYFQKIGALFTTLPLTTRMISSPGALYGKEMINYTTDTTPVTLKWFNNSKEIFLSESSQIYLELSLIQKNIDQVFSIYNSFRKEEADSTHLSEFHHIEYEGKVTQNKNLEIIWGLLSKFLKDCTKNNLEDLLYFLSDEKLAELKRMSRKSSIKEITFEEVLDILYRHTHNKNYKKFTLKYFGPWEEVKITEILGELIAIREFPLLEVPFYHATLDNSNPLVAQNADIIWPRYREIIGSGHRVKSLDELKRKVNIFNLPKNDYKPYIISRTLPNYKPTSGFGLGWERLIQGLLELPFIWSATHFPRGHKIINL
jgi:aspartyl/asparaginyl-tRNA synthetase